MLSPSFDPYLDESLYDPQPSDDLAKDKSTPAEESAKRKLDLSGEESQNEDEEITFNPRKKPCVRFEPGEKEGNLGLLNISELGCF